MVHGKGNEDHIMKLFTEADVVKHSDDYHRIYLEDRFEELSYTEGILRPGPDGYIRDGASDWLINFEGKLRRCRVTQISNAGSMWFNVGKRRIYLA